VIGNDIVDLHFPDSPSYQHVEYLKRVCTAEELRVVRYAENPSVTLAILWACKEAAYKLFSKKNNCRFVPGNFAVRFGNRARPTATEWAMVTYDGKSTKVNLSLDEHWVQAIALSPAVQCVRWTVREIARCFWDGCKARDESEAVRLLAAELVARYCQEDVRLEFHGRAPILTFKTGGRAAIGLSFSHHGKFAAVAAAWPIGDSWRIMAGSGVHANAPAREEACSTCTA
jgi:phosphopantetheinyl transferase (holo-ACP synthase)